MKIGLLGYGFMGGVHLAAMQRISGITVTHVATSVRPSPDAPKRGNLDLPSGPLPDAVTWVPDWRSIITDPHVDAVDICLPTYLHCDVVLAALAAGKHVLCEKPMALTVDDCERMLAAAEAARRVFMVGQVLRFMFPYIAAEEFVRSTGRENIQNAVLHRSTGFPQWGGWLTDPEKSGGAILDLLSHDLDQALHLFGPPATVRAQSIGPVDTMRGVLHYTDGLMVTVEGGWTEPGQPFAASFSIQGRNSRLTLQDDTLQRASETNVQNITIPAHDAYHDQIAYFVECCRRSIAPQRCPPAASADAVRISLLLNASREANGRELAWTQV